MTATSAGTIVYNVEADVKNLVSNMAQTREELSKSGQEMDRTDKSAAKLETGLSGLSKAFAALGVAKALSSATQLVEKYNEYADRIRLATANTQEFEMVQARLAETANNTYRSLSEAQEVFITTSSALKSLGYTTSQALDITDSLSYAMVKNATSVDRANSAIGAFSKIIQTGKVEADSWSSILLAVPTIVNDIASATGKSASQIRLLGASGKLAADDINQSLLKSLVSNKEAADAMATSTKDAFRQIENSLGKTLSALNEQSGALDAVVSGLKLAAVVIQDFGNNTEAMSNFLSIAGTAAAATATIIAGRLVGSLGSYAVAQGAVVAATLGSVNASQAAAGASLMLANAELAAAKAAEAKLVSIRAANLGLAQGAASSDAMAAASARVAAAQAGVTTALAASAGAATTATAAMSALRGVMTFLGGPLGVILIAAAALYYFASASQQTKTDVDSLNKSLKTLSFNQLAKASNDAGDDIVKLNTKLSSAMSELRTQTRRPFESDEGFNKRQTETAAEIDGIRQQIKARQDLQASIKAQQDENGKKQTEQASGKSTRQTAPEDKTAIENLEKQRDLAKLAGEARARLAAEQKLSADASADEKKKAGDLAVEIYRLEEAKKSVIKTTKEGAAEQKKTDEEAKKGAEQNKKAIDDYAVSISLAALKGEDLAKAAAVAKLNKFATPEDVKVMEALGKAMYANQQIEENKKLLQSVDPAAAEAERFRVEMENLKKLNDAKLLEGAAYDQKRLEAAQLHDANVRALEEAAFIRQSEGNAFLIRSIDALGQATTNTITGLLSGTMNAQDAMKSFASIVLNEAVGSVVQLGVQAVKQALIQRAAAATAAAGYVAGVSAQVATTTALAAQAAFASTAAIPVVGPAAAPAAATAAGAAAAALGAPAIGSAAGVAAGRLYGGDVNAGSMYAVAEDGKPEMFQADNGKKYMIPGTGGSVTSNKDLGGGGGVFNISIVVNSDGSSSTSGSSSEDANRLADNVRSVVVQQIQQESMQGGAIWEIMNNG